MVLIPIIAIEKPNILNFVTLDKGIRVISVLLINISLEKIDPEFC